jgi:hypothetical protein
LIIQSTIALEEKENSKYQVSSFEEMFTVQRLGDIGDTENIEQDKEQLVTSTHDE